MRLSNWFMRGTWEPCQSPLMIGKCSLLLSIIRMEIFCSSNLLNFLTILELLMKFRWRLNKTSKESYKMFILSLPKGNKRLVIIWSKVFKMLYHWTCLSRSSVRLDKKLINPLSWSFLSLPRNLKTTLSLTR